MCTTNKRYKLYREFIYAPQSRYMRLLDRYMTATYDTANDADCTVELRPYRASWLSAGRNCPSLPTCTSAECIALFASAFPFLLLYFRWPF